MFCYYISWSEFVSRNLEIDDMSNIHVISYIGVMSLNTIAEAVRRLSMGLLID